jgi:hypothetical protein
MATEPCGHLSLFLGAGLLGGTWRRIAHWLGQDAAIATAHTAEKRNYRHDCGWRGNE